MFAFPIHAILTALICSALFTPTTAIRTHNHSIETRSGTPSSSGQDYDGYYYYWASSCGTTSPAAEGTYIHYGPGAFSLTWSGICDIMGGKGWNPGSRSRIVVYSGDYIPTNNSARSSLSIYGWTINPLIEYYIVEAYSGVNPAAGAVKKGGITCDGAIYDVLQTTRYNQTSIHGTQTFEQYWSVRNPPKSPGRGMGGTVTAECHFKAWLGFGMNLGSEQNLQILGVGAHTGSGGAAMTVSQML